MVTLTFLIIAEILTYITIRQHFYEKSWMKFYFIYTINLILSIWVWILWYESESFNGFFDEPEHVWIMLNLGGMLFGVIFPRMVLSGFHFAGVIAKGKAGGHKRSWTNIGLILAGIIFLFAAWGVLGGRFNFTTERRTVKIKGLNPGLEGLKIVQISDLHMACYYHHPELMKEVMERVSKEKPDLLINTGDFVTFGWREYAGFDSILRIPKAKYGNFAILGNHDIGTYDPDFSEADVDNNISLMTKKITHSGYKVLEQNSAVVKIGNARLGITGILTRGSWALQASLQEDRSRILPMVMSARQWPGSIAPISISFLHMIPTSG